jgi:ABC-2 type transport system permease protein
MNSLAGLGPYLRLILRRDRIRLVVWFGLAILLTVGIAASIGSAFPTEEARAAYAEETNSSAAEVFLIGRINATTIAGIAAWRVQGFAVLLLGLASAFTVMRHTRAAEEDGYREFMGAATLGRLTPLAAPVIVALSANLVSAAVIAAAYVGMGFPPNGSMLVGVQFLAAGAVMTGVGAVTAQLAATARGASGLAVVIMSIFYVLRGTADAAALPGLHWATPYGWIDFVEPYAVDDGWPVLLALVFTAVLLVIATVLNVRDVGGGLLPERSGRLHAGRGLRGPISLAFRLSAGTLIAWSLSMFVFGVLIAAIAENTARQLTGSDALEGLAGGPEPGLGFIAFVVYVFAQLVTVFGIQAVIRLLGEETSGRAENVLSAPVSRLHWGSGALVVALTGTAIIQLAFGSGLGLAYASATGDATQLPAMISATLVKLPAIWIVTALAALLYGFLPRMAAAVTYAALGVLFLLELLADLKFIDRGVLAISPYTQVPPLPVGSFELLPIVVITGLAVVLIAAGVLGLRRRDLLH